MKLGQTADPGTNRRFILLSPQGSAPGDAFQRVSPDGDCRQELLADMQRLRGRTYLQDGAISARDLTPDGRHVQPIDEKAWHLLIVNSHDRVVGCTRYLLQSATTPYHRLRIRSAALARSEEWRLPFQRAVECELGAARHRGFSYLEISGWAVDESVRGSSDAVRSVLFAYAWSQVMGGCLGLSMATHRNGSASILRRIGGRPLEWAGLVLPPYYDAQYNCEMEVIRFDSSLPNARYQNAVNEIRSQIPDMPVISAPSVWETLVSHMPRVGAALVPGWGSEGVAPAA